MTLFAPLCFFSEIFKVNMVSLDGLLTIFIVISIFWQFIRSSGNKKIEYENNRNNPTVLSLFRTEISGKPYTYEDITLDRFHNKLSLLIPGWHAPNIIEEINNYDFAYDTYHSAVRWLRENTRDKNKYPLVYTELVEFTKQKTLNGIKMYVMLVHVVIFIICIVLTLVKYKIIQDTVGIFAQPAESLVYSPFVILLGILIWVFMVNKKSVLQSSIAYARSLITAIDSL
jgi:hypothetical protein